MPPLKRLCLWLVLLAGAFGGGFYTGKQLSMPAVAKATYGIDPQDQITTVCTPYQGGLTSYLEFLDKARESVHIAVYSYTHPSITDKLIELSRKRQVKIRIILDRSQTLGRSGDYEIKEINRLRAAGIEVTIGTSEKAGAIMHHKYTVIDGLWVHSGSWNFSKNADLQNNLLDYMRSPKRARLLLENWERMYRYMRGG